MKSANEGATPPTWKLMIVRWLALLPAIMLVSYGIKWAPIDPPLWLKLVIETLVIVPLMHYVITPAVDVVFSAWLYKGIDEEQRGKSAELGLRG